MPTAINAGDAMLAIAFERLVQAENLEPTDVAPLVNRIAWMVRRVSEGQQLDIEFEDRLEVSEEDYLEMIEGKRPSCSGFVLKSVPEFQGPMMKRFNSWQIGARPLAYASN